MSDATYGFEPSGFLNALIAGFFDWAPRLIVFAVTLLVGWIVGRLLYSAVSRIVGRMGWEHYMRKTVIGRAILSSGYTAGTFSASVVKWLTYLVAILYSIYALNIPELSAGVSQVLAYLPSLVTGIVILVVGLILADWTAELVRQGQPKSELSTLASDVVRVFLYFIVITVALANMRIDITIIYIFATPIAWSIAIILGIVVGWTLKDRVKELIERVLRGSEGR
ncbi:MAG: hypothetical protein B9J98_04475 [Candidatus Terraquivivens tikiterensis]|uniref:Uncharacterized protein n=1 Tax=Candidatus Terraquivivens tikiterensis TaxID=1980982 RepID=A0A2R7Y3M6_9ARCH|nr:MAG: hypothetical protein B9J98_04475 [Candidatus Terraquivivens tikiterensis]